MLGPLLCDLSSLRLPFSRSYGVILPSSLTMLLPFVLGSSPHLPVSVCGTGTSIQFSQAFLVSVILDTSLLLFHYIFRYESFLFLAYLPLLRPLRFLSISVVQESYTCSPSATLLSLTLGPDLPWADEPSPGNLRLSTAWILTMLSLLIPAFSHALATYSGILSSISSIHPFGYTSSYYRMLLYH